MVSGLEGVLAEHQPEDIADHYCACSDYRLGEPWTAHVAAVLREQIAAWLGSDAAANAAQVGVHATESCEPDPSVEQYAASVLAALAAREAADEAIAKSKRPAKKAAKRAPRKAGS